MEDTEFSLHVRGEQVVYRERAPLPAAPEQLGKLVV